MRRISFCAISSVMPAGRCIAHRCKVTILLPIVLGITWLLLPDSAVRCGRSAEQIASGPSSQSSWLDRQDKAGSTAESEQAVELALRWLAEHQLANGGWSFDHRVGRCQGQCANPGRLNQAVNAATGMALLPFICHGNTHGTGPYRKNVAAGLQFLIRRIGDNGGFWEQGGTMYSHALATWALCEDCRILGETLGDLSTGSEPRSATDTIPQPKNADTVAAALIRAAATKALVYTVYAQDRAGGGWRYRPRESSDTSVTGWQVVALHSATKAGFPVGPRTVQGVTGFLDSVQSNYGSTYGYTVQQPRPSPTCCAIGLLCRIYTGWERDCPGLQAGVSMLARQGPSEQDMYYNYYATLVLHHVGGPAWENWNRLLREYLIRNQCRLGHQTGSWHFDGLRCDKGGRLYNTVLACLILETYYRSPSVYSDSQISASPANQAAEMGP